MVTLPAALALWGDALDEGLVAFDAAGRYTYVNAAAAALLGRAPETLVGRTPREAFPDAAEPVEGPTWTALRRVMATQGSEVFESHIPAWERWFEHRAHPAPGGGVLLFFRDVTARKRDHAERERLLAAEARARAVAEAAARQLQEQAAELEGANAALQEQAAELEATSQALRASAAERERLLARAEGLQALNAALARAVTTTEVVQAAIREAGRGVGSHGGALALLDPDASTFTLVAGPGITPEIESSWMRWPNAGSLPGPEAVRAGRPVYSRTRAEYVGRDPALAEVAERLDIEAEATLPLVVGDRTLGVLSLIFGAPRDFEPDDAFLRTVADQCAQALERARLLEAEAAARRTADADRTRLAGLHALSAALSGARTVAEVADAIGGAGAAALGAEQAGVALLDPGGATFRFRVLRDVPDDIADAWHTFPNTPAIPYGAVALSRAVLVLPSQAAILAQFPAVTAEITRQNLQTLVVLPLVRGASAAVASPPDGRDPGTPATPRLAGAAGDGSDTTGAAASRVFGAVHYGFRTPQRVDRADEVAFAAVARQCAEAFERARLFEAERDARTRAEAANRARSEFLATMSHELRTPLNAIQGHVQLLELELHGPLSAAQRAALQRVGRAQTHLLGLINDVLNYAKLEAGKVEYDVREVHLADVVRDLVPLIEPQRQARGLVLDVSLPGTHGPSAEDGHVWADREKLGQVLLNLLTNAVKFTPPLQADGTSGRITVEVATPPGTPTVTELRVRDTGIGIPPEKHAAIFEPFVQVSSGLTRASEGTGLGLAISRDLARGMGGDVVVESEPGAGTTFTIRLRRVVTATGEPTDRRLAPAGEGGGRRDGVERRSRQDRRTEDPGAHGA